VCLYTCCSWFLNFRVHESYFLPKCWLFIINALEIGLLLVVCSPSEYPDQIVMVAAFKDGSSLVNQLWITRSGVSSQPLSKLLRNQETLPSLSLPLGWDLDQSPPFHRNPFNHLTISLLLCIILIVVSLSNASSCNYREMKDKRDHQWSRLLDMLSRINYIRPPLTT